MISFWDLFLCAWQNSSDVTWRSSNPSGFAEGFEEWLVVEELYQAQRNRSQK